MMHRLKIRTKLALWYAITIIGLLVIFFTVLFFSLSPSVERVVEQRLTQDSVEISGKLDEDDDILELEEFNVNAETIYSIYYLDSTLFSRNHTQNWLDSLPIKEDQLQQISNAGQRWLVFDSAEHDDGDIIAYVRVASHLTELDYATSQLLIIFLVTLPAICIFALFIGMRIAKHALRPINDITLTAQKISQGDLSERLNVPITDDEVGNLAQTFDQMIGSLQVAFERERQFTSDASHELRTPITVIRANAESVLHRTDATTEEYKEAIQAIYQKTISMQSMLTQMLLIARGQKQDRIMEQDSINLSFVLNDIIEEFYLSAENKFLTIHQSLEPDIFVNGDLLMLTRAFMNIIDNAIKYSNPGESIYVTLKKLDNFAVISFKDTGIGIAEKDLPHLFDRFFRSDLSRTGDGTGLGLAIVKMIVDSHKGFIDVHSQPGNGSTFIIKLPL